MFGVGDDQGSGRITCNMCHDDCIELCDVTKSAIEF